MLSQDGKIWCEKCQEFHTPHRLQRKDGYCGRVCCLDTDCVVGYTWDLEWLEIVPEWTIDDVKSNA